MPARKNPVTILVVNDDEDNRFLIREALQEVGIRINYYLLEDGEELLAYLFRRDRYANPTNSPRPDLILLDLNMPNINGLDALTQIKSDPNLRLIPVVILTTSHQPKDIVHSYSLGANSFIAKPLTFEALVETMKILCRYWFEIISLP